MASRLDQLLRALAAKQITLDEARRSLIAMTREDPKATQLWPMLLQARITQGELNPADGKHLLDALSDFEPEKTMWLAPGNSDNPRGEVLRTPVSRDPARTPGGIAPAINTAEQLRAFLWGDASEAKTAKDAIALDRIPAIAPPPRARTDAPPALPPLELGAVIKNRYRLESRLGFSGIGQIFNAIDLEAERAGKRDARITIKVVGVDLKREPQALMAMKIAVAKVKGLKHPNIVRTFGVESDNERLYVLMEPLFGRWLGERLRAARDTGVSPEVAWPIIEGVANGLAHAHGQGIVHSDLSPYSIFLAFDGTPKILGFGLVHALPTSNEALDLMDTMTLRAYSEAYTANSWATHATPHPGDDLYPLGVIAYELLTGRHPFQRSTLAVARQKQMSVAPIPGISRRAAKLIQHCLAFERKERPADAQRFLTRMGGPGWLRFIFGERFAPVPGR